MKTISDGLKAHLESGATTLCRCWLLTRKDGVALGFTDHDIAVDFDGVSYSALSGVASSGDVLKSGFGVGGLEIDGALTSAGLEAEDLRSGRYDGATVELWLVNWRDVEERVLLRRGSLGEVTKRDGAFTAEVRGPMQALETVRGRVFTTTCDADLGDARCGVDVLALASTATIATVDGVHLTVREDSAGEAGAFAGGVLSVTGGAQAGARVAIVEHVLVGEEARLTLRNEVVRLAAGDAVSLTPGCDKRFATCRRKFDNALNFRGFPHIPGNDRAFSYARSSS